MLRSHSVLAGLAFAVVVGAQPALAQQTVDAKWVWFDEGNPAESAPAGKVWFRREARAQEPSTGTAIVACDDDFTLWVNGQKVGTGEGGKSYRFSLNGIVERGTNVFAVEASNKSARAGLLVEAEIRGQSGRDRISADTGGEWRATKTAPQGDGWLQLGFDAASWKPVRVLGSHSETPWKDIAFSFGELDQFQVAPGFEIKRIAGNDLVGSLIAMTWGNRGRLIVSRERGPILNVIDSDGDGTYDKVTEYSTAVRNCQGLCMVFDDLYAVGQGPNGTGLYRLPDKNHDDQADEVVLIVKQRGDIGEHGPHDVIFGPDGWLYHNLGNHSEIVNKPELTSPCRNWQEGYLLEPAFEDAGGHAVGKKAPGGATWRFTPDGKQWWIETMGYRNHYDFAFNRQGDMFTFDSDMEWDVNMPWYKPVRVNHAIPGSEFGWRSGAKNWPEWYFDALPGTVNIGRGSPTGVVFYEHTQFPEKYQGAMLNCDWSMGRIIVAYLERDGATYKGTAENLVTGNPLNVSDIEVDCDGSVVFCTGGRNTQGGLYRISHTSGAARTAKTPKAETLDHLLAMPQPQATWNREAAAALKEKLGQDWESGLIGKVRSGTPVQKIRALTLLSQHGPKPDQKVVLEAAADADPGVRQFAVLLLGDHPSPETAAALAKLLTDSNAAVQRRACEAFVRSGLEAPVEPLVRLLSGNDRWLRFAARIALERVPVEKWKAAVLSSADVNVQLNGLLAVYRQGPETWSAAETLGVLAPLFGKSQAPAAVLDLRRMLELVLVRLKPDDPLVADIGQKFGPGLLSEFTRQTNPSRDQATATPVARESAELLAWLDVPGATDALMRALLATKGDNSTQMHYALCLRYARSGWSDAIKTQLLDWYDTTRDWEGGNSLHGYLRNIVSGCLERYTPEDRRKFILAWKERPHAAQMLLAASKPEQVADFAGLGTLLLGEFEKSSSATAQTALSMAIDVLGRANAPDTQALLRKLFEENPDRRDILARALARRATAEDVPALLRALATGDGTTIQACVQALGRLDYKPSKPEELRTAIIAALKLEGRARRNGVTLLRRWTGSDAPGGDDAAIAHYQKWFAEKYPSEPAAELSEADADKAGYTVAQLLEFLEGPLAAKGDIERGRQVFAKANCAKCHKFVKDGEGVGPDLTTLRRRFQKKEIVEAILLPSQVVSDQFSAMTITTNEGLVHTGLVLPNPDPNVVVLLLPDATRLQIATKNVEEQAKAKVSVMPEGLLKPLSLEEVADLFAFLETSKNNAEPTGAK